MIQPVGYFKTWRELFNKPIWLNSTPEQCKVLFTLIAMANYNGNEWEWKGEKFKAEKGQFITSLESITQSCGKGITIQNVRTSLARFEKLGFLTNESTKTGRLITIVNWGIYQGSEDKTNIETNKDLTKSQQRPNKDLTTIEEGNKEENYKNDKENMHIPYSEIIEYLNLKLNSKYKHTTGKNRELIKARWNENNTLNDFKTVIDKKCNEWLGTDHAKYLRPETLFGTKFESYLNQQEGNNGGNRPDNKQTSTGPTYDFSKYGG